MKAPGPFERFGGHFILMSGRSIGKQNVYYNLCPGILYETHLLIVSLLLDKYHTKRYY